MADLFEAVASPLNLLWVLLAFGFAPGFALRIIVRLYPKGDPRRAELVAELYAVPRIQRPLWVAEQIEVALFEGLNARLAARHARKAASENKLKRNTRILATLAAVTAVGILAIGPFLGLSILIALVVAGPLLFTAIILAAICVSVGLEKGFEEFGRRLG